MLIWTAARPAGPSTVGCGKSKIVEDCDVLNANRGENTFKKMSSPGPPRLIGAWLSDPEAAGEVKKPGYADSIKMTQVYPILG